METASAVKTESTMVPAHLVDGGDEAATPETTAQALAEALDPQLLARLAAQARAQGVSLLGRDGLLQQLTKRFLEAEMDEHLGYGKHDLVGRNRGNSRNGKRSKTLLTEVGPVGIEMPRDRDGAFSATIVRKRQRRLVPH